MNEQGITDPQDQAVILANFHAESNLKPINENMGYSGERAYQVFGKKYFSSVEDARAVVAQGQEALGNRVYGGRMGNGKDEGYKFRGRGFVQLTGKSNYARYSQLVFGDDRLVKNPDLLLDPEVAARVSAAYVKDRTKGSYTVENVTKGIGPRDLSNEIAKRRGLVGRYSKAPAEMATLNQQNTAQMTASSTDQTMTPYVMQSNADAKASNNTPIIVSAPQTNISTPNSGGGGGGSAGSGAPLVTRNTAQTSITNTNNARMAHQIPA